MPCRFNVRKIWTGRIILEAHLHQSNCFVTLTYKDAPSELRKEDLRNFLKRLRKALAPRKIRYFACGEYGELRDRPHFHLALFGVHWDEVEVIAKAWDEGFVHAGDLTHESAQYVAGYVVKKVGGASDPYHDGRTQEYAVMSRNPGLGARAMLVMGEQLLQDGPSRGLAKEGDVPNHFLVGRKNYPLGRYLRRELRKAVGWDPDTPQEVIQKHAAEFLSQTAAEKEKRERNRMSQYETALGRSKLNSSKKRF